jgi:archaellum biogenesis ATPase FlaH
VFPCVPGEKRPLTQNGLLAATTEPGQIDAWWTQHPNANIGIACGPSRIVALDVDVKNDGAASYEALRSSLSAALFETVTAGTPSGGQHLLYSAVGIIASGVNCIGTGIDIRAQGGYIVAAPSRVAGKVYAWEVGYGPHEFALLPWPSEINAKIVRGERAPVLVAGEPIRHPGRNAALTSIAGTMRRRGLGAEEILAALQVTNRNRCQPPLAESEITLIAQSVSRYAPADLPTAPVLAVPAVVRRDTSPQLEHFSEVLGRIEGVIEDHSNGPKFGFRSLDKSLGGVLPGRLTTVAARTGIGKSAFAETVALSVARSFRVLYYSLEMGSERFVERVAARKSGMSVLDFQRAGRPAANRDWVESLDMWVVDKTRRLDLEDLEKHLDLHYPNLVILDHARHIAGWFPKSGGRRADIAPAEIMYGLSDLATQYKTHIMMLHQCNREADGARPTLGELRDSGAVEEASDNVLLLHRPWMTNGVDDTLEVIIAKSRECGFAKAHLSWDGQRIEIREPQMTDIINVRRCCPQQAA